MDRENRNLEYKEKISDTFLKTVSAYANYGKGRIVFGVDDTGQIVGLNGKLKELCLNLENKINDSMDPVPRYDIMPDEKKRTITLVVYEGVHKPYLYKNKAYKRADTASVPVDRVELNRLVLEGTHQSFDKLPASTQNLQFKYLEKELKAALYITKLNMDIFKTLGLYEAGTGYNKAAEILADRNAFPGIDLVRFGNSISQISDRETLDGLSVLEQYDAAIQMYRKYYQYEVIESARRQRTEQIPETAFREALANALVHRTWDVAAAVRVAMFEECIEISSPGGLPSGISEQEYLYSQVSIMRNPILGGVFLRLGIIEKFGTGIRRINEAYAENIVKPEYHVLPHSVRIVLPIYTKKTDALDADELKIYELLEKRGAASRSELETDLGMGKAKTLRILNALLERNVLQKIGNIRSTKYDVIR